MILSQMVLSNSPGIALTSKLSHATPPACFLLEAGIPKQGIDFVPDPGNL